MVNASRSLLRSIMLPRAAFSTSVTLSWPAAWARRVGASVTCKMNNCTAATSINTKMTTLPARCRKTNDAPRVPTSTSWRVRRSRAEWPGAASGRPAARDLLVSLAFRNLLGSRTSLAFLAFCGLRGRLGCFTSLVSRGLLGPRVARVACDRPVRLDSPRLTRGHPAWWRWEVRTVQRWAAWAPGPRGRPAPRPGGPQPLSPVAPESALRRVAAWAPGSVPGPAVRPTELTPRRAPEQSLDLLGPADPASASHPGPGR